MEFLLYNESRSDALSLEEVGAYLEDRFPGAGVGVKNGFIGRYYRGDPAQLAERMARLRVTDPSRPFTPNEPVYGEVQFELRVLEGKASPAGLLYDGPRMAGTTGGCCRRGYVPLTSSTSSSPTASWGASTPTTSGTTPG
ncbi:MAG: hypothetical protein GXO65_06790 [Euryarchaeota archaeon]|nr:hypothetical protein [Euryarchaeota archaeon]